SPDGGRSGRVDGGRADGSAPRPGASVGGPADEPLTRGHVRPSGGGRHVRVDRCRLRRDDRHHRDRERHVAVVPDLRGARHPRDPRGRVLRARQGRARPARPPAPPPAPLTPAPAGRAVASPAARPDPSASPSALRRRTPEGRTRAGDAMARTAGRGPRADQGARRDERAPGTASCDGALDLTTAYDRWVALVRAVVARRLDDPADTDDATQLVFLAAWRSRDRFDPDRGDLPVWLIGIADHVCADLRRARAREARRREAAGRHRVTTAVPDAADDVAARVDLERALRRLAPVRR